jgi:acetyltransferase-like isoleucine patch superfamily enzyme
VVTAGSIVTQSQPEGMVCGGNPCAPIRPRWIRNHAQPALDAL